MIRISIPCDFAQRNTPHSVLHSQHASPLNTLPARRLCICSPLSATLSNILYPQSPYTHRLHSLYNTIQYNTTDSLSNPAAATALPPRLQPPRLSVFPGKRGHVTRASQRSHSFRASVWSHFR